MRTSEVCLPSTRVTCRRGGGNGKSWGRRQQGWIQDSGLGAEDREAEAPIEARRREAPRGVGSGVRIKRLVSFCQCHRPSKTRRLSDVVFALVSILRYGL